MKVTREEGWVERSNDFSEEDGQIRKRDGHSVTGGSSDSIQ